MKAQEKLLPTFRSSDHGDEALVCPRNWALDLGYARLTSLNVRASKADDVSWTL